MHASASRQRKYGRHNSVEVARDAARPSRICAIPSSLCPCSAIAQPRTVDAQAKKSVNPRSAESAILSLRSLLSCACFPPRLTEYADKIFGKSQTMGIGQPLSQRERFIAPLESLVRVAKLPQSQARVRQAPYPGINSIAEGERPLALRIIEEDRHPKMLPGRKQHSHPEQGASQSVPRVHQ